MRVRLSQNVLHCSVLVYYALVGSPQHTLCISALFTVEALHIYTSKLTKPLKVQKDGMTFIIEFGVTYPALMNYFPNTILHSVLGAFIQLAIRPTQIRNLFH